MILVIDSDVVIQILRGLDQHMAAMWSRVTESGSTLFVSPVTAAEIWAGVRISERRATADFFEGLICIPVDYAIGRLAGEFMNLYAKSHNLKLGDALIAATAVQLDAALWTRNIKHYPMPQLTLL